MNTRKLIEYMHDNGFIDSLDKQELERVIEDQDSCTEQIHAPSARWQWHCGEFPCVFYSTAGVPPFNPMHGDVDKIPMPEMNPGSDGQMAYIVEIMNIIKNALNLSGIKPYYDAENLQSQSDIAAELAARDAIIEELTT